MDTKIILQVVGRRIVKTMQAKLAHGRAPYGSKNATGNLSRSIKWSITNGTLNITMNSYGKFVQSGRGRNKRMPPVDDIEKWVRVRGIKPNKGGTVRGLAFGIAKKIARDSIIAFDFQPPSTKEIFDEVKKELTIQVSKEFIQEIRKFR